MSDFGLCFSRGSMADSAELAGLGLVGPSRWVRIFAGSNNGTFDDVEEMLCPLAPSTRVFVTLNSEYAEVGSDYSRWESAVETFARRFRGRVDAVGCGNELDSWHWQPPIGDKDPRLTPSFAAQLAVEASPFLRAAGMRCVLTSVASQWWYDYLRQAAYLARDAVDWVDLHLYAKRAGGIPAGSDWQTPTAALQQAHEITGKPVACSEAGIPLAIAGGADQQGAWVRGLLEETRHLDATTYPLVCVFAWCNAIGASHEQGLNGFGLRDGDLGQLPAWEAFASATGGTGVGGGLYRPETTPEFKLGFADIASRYPDLVGEPVENERGGIVGFSQQRTTRGLLTFADLRSGRAFTFYEDATGVRWRYVEESGEMVAA